MRIDAYAYDGSYGIVEVVLIIDEPLSHLLNGWRRPDLLCVCHTKDDDATACHHQDINPLWVMRAFRAEQKKRSGYPAASSDC